MNTRDLIARLRDLGVKLAVVDGELRISAPKGVMTPELRSELAGAKEQLIELLGAGTGEHNLAAAPIPHADRNKVLPLSFAQQRMWFMEEFKEGTSIYNIAWAMRIQGNLDVSALEAAINNLVARHETLRTTFTANEGEPAQLIAAHLHLPLETLTLPGAAQAEIQQRLSEWSKEPFNLRTGPLLKARLLALGTNDHVLMLVIHHIISDAWSLDVLQREFVAFYKARSTGQDAGLPELPLQFADYAVWQQDRINETERARQLAYWKRQLAGAAPVLELPVDRPRPVEQSFNGARCRQLMPLHLQQALSKLARQYDGTLFMVLLAAFEVLLHRYTGQNDIVVGTPIAGRQRSELETLIGLFLNTLVMRADLGGNPGFTALLQQVQKTSFDAYAHQDLPFERLVDVLAPERNTGYSPVFQVLFMLQNAPSTGQPLEGLQITPIEFDYGTAKFDLTLATGETPDGLVAEIEYNTDLFDAVTIERMLRHYAALLEAIAANPQQRIGELPLLDAAEQAQLERWNDTDFDYDRTLTMHALFEQQAAAQPDAIALWADGESFSYAELNRRANRLAQHLVTLGACPGTLIGVCVERRAHMITGLLAILKSGAAYVPLDPDYPAERVQFMLDDSQAPIVLTQTNLVSQLPDGERARVCLDTFDWGSPQQALPNVTSTVQATDLGYVIYTSGSTGKPKGVSIEHRNAVALIKWTADAFDRREFDGVLASTSICFDLSVFEIFCTLGLGGRVVLVRNALALPELPADVGVTLVNTVPSAIAELVRMRGVPASVQTVNLAGEPLTTELADAIYALGTVRDVNDLYGPSEDTTYSTWIRRTVGAAPRIGKPIHNTQAYVLDQYGMRLPVGIPGELYLGGSGVTREYLRRPELSAEKFLPDRFRQTSTGRLYRTGDRVRYHRDGNLEFLGRIDHQIKLRGFRIELGEIESNLRAQPEIDKTVVIVREDTPGDQRLVAYVTPAGSAQIDTDALRQALRKNLPDHMIPAAFVILDAIPLTPNGKTDRKALPAPEWTAAEESYAPPRTPLEAQLCDIWAATLSVAQVGIHDDFFALGGHSLLAMKLVSRIRDSLRIELPLQALFSNPTVAGIAAHAGADAGAATLAIMPCARSGPLPMSFAQQRMWFLYLMEPDAATYNVPWAIRLRGHIDRALLQRAVDDLVRRHESLRTVFANSDEEPVQIIMPPQLEVAIESIAMAHATDAAVTARLHELGHRPFNLQRGPPLRVGLIDRGNDDYVLLLCMHHIICDAWSHELLYRELVTLYEGYRRNTPVALPDLPIQYGDYAVWQRTQLRDTVLDQQLDYWKAQLNGAPPLLNLPLDKPRPAIETHVGASASMQLDRELTDALHRQARACGGTLFSLLLAAFTLLLHRYSGEDDIVIGTPVSGRRRSELEGIIGFFLNTLAIRSDLAANPAFDQLAKRTARNILDALTHQDLPFEKLVEELQPVRNLSHAPIFQVLFVLNRLSDNMVAFTDVTVSPADSGYVTAKFDLELHVTETPAGLVPSITYNVTLFNAATIEKMLGHYRLLLQGIAANPQQRIDALPLLDPHEYNRIVYELNATAVAYPALSIVDMVEARVAATPDAQAIQAGTTRFSYAELNARANRLSRHLLQLGAKAGELIAVCAERSIDTPVAILAVLKTGAAYVPIDPNYPPERVHFMLDDCRAGIVLTQSALADKLPAHDGAVIAIDTFDWQSNNADNPGIAIAGDSPAYVIYTSGSTGNPKGVLLPHCGLTNLLQWQTSRTTLTNAARTLQFASFSFDVSFQEIFSTWQQGGTLVMIDEALRRDLPALARFIAAERIERLYLPYAAFQPLVDCILNDKLENDLAIRDVVVAGEQLQITPSIRQLFRQLPAAHLHNQYGPSETHVVTACTLNGDADHWPLLPPIGKPVSNTQTYVLDTQLQPVPIGVPGELYIGGIQVALGYLNRDDLSAEKFRPDVFSKQPGARLYRTGDRVRILASGDLEYLGRTDDQVKWRGFRIEPGEIESTLAAHPQVQQVAVMLREDSPGDRQLIAYVVAESGTKIDTTLLRAFAKEKLPEHMLPSAFVLLEAMPLTPSGKVARRSLPAPETIDAVIHHGALPASHGERAMAEIWKRLLKVKQVHLQDNFFDLGGHSLLTIKLIQELEKATGQRRTIADVFENPTLAEFSALLSDDAWPAGAKNGFSLTRLRDKLKSWMARA